MENKQIIEINGIKMEVDLRTAKRISEYKVGDHIKVLIKEYSGYKSHIGTIIGFDNFEKLPTIKIAYCDVDYNSAEIRFVDFNAETKDTEITSLNDWDLPITKDDVIRKFNKDIENKEEELKQIKGKKQMFIKLFGKYFDDLNA